METMRNIEKQEDMEIAETPVGEDAFKESIKGLTEKEKNLAIAKRIAGTMDGTPYVKGSHDLLDEEYREGLTPEGRRELARRIADSMDR